MQLAIHIRHKCRKLEIQKKGDGQPKERPNEQTEIMSDGVTT